MHVKTVHGDGEEDLDEKINRAVKGKKVKDIKFAYNGENNDYGFLGYSALILFDD